VSGLSAIEILYILFLIWSLAFGLEVMLIGLGGRLMVLYRRWGPKMFLIALAIGLATVLPAISASIVFNLEPIFFCALLVAFVFVAGGIVNVVGSKRIRTPQPPIPTGPSDEEMKELIRRRGLGELVGKKRMKTRSIKKSGC
jgi:hypothetical protein